MNDRELEDKSRIMLKTIKTIKSRHPNWSDEKIFKVAHDWLAQKEGMNENEK